MHSQILSYVIYFAIVALFALSCIRSLLHQTSHTQESAAMTSVNLPSHM
jgi:hypothetical protein